MSQQDAFGRILAALHEAALDSDAWTGAAALIHEALGVHGSTLACGDGESEEDFQLYFMWFCLHGERRTDLERLWWETGFPADRTVSRCRHLPFDRTTHITDLYTEEELRTALGYHLLKTRARAGNAINIRLEGPGDSRIFWQVNDPVDRDGWTSGKLDRVRRLRPHVRQTVHVRQALAGAGALGESLAGLLDATGLGIVQLARAGGSWRPTMGPTWRLVRQGRFPVRARADDDLFQAVLARALPPFGDRGRLADNQASGAAAAACRAVCTRRRSGLGGGRWRHSYCSPNPRAEPGSIRISLRPFWGSPRRRAGWRVWPIDQPGEAPIPRRRRHGPVHPHVQAVLRAWQRAIDSL